MGDTEKKNLLKSSRLFKEFSPEVVELMASMLHSCSFSAGTTICMKGDASDCLYIISKGEVEVSVSSSDGKIILLDTLSTGDVFGEVGLLDSGTRTATVTAQTDVSFYKLNRNDFKKLSESFGIKEFKALTYYICLLFRRATNNLEETAFLDADIRVSRKIKDLCTSNSNQTDGEYKITISQESLGKMVGLSREATNKALSHLEDRGLIKRQYKGILIPDVKEFLRILKDD